MSYTKIDQNSSKSENHQNRENKKKWKSDKNQKMKKHKKWQNSKSWNLKCAKMCQNSPSDPPHVIFGLKTGSRGTPRDWKNAGPGGSDFAKCRFCPISWHFGLFQGGSIFDTFFVDFHFYTFLILCIFVFLHFSCFVDFDEIDVLSFWPLFCNKALL